VRAEAARRFPPNGVETISATVVSNVVVLTAVSLFVAIVSLNAIARYEAYLAFGDLTAFDQFFWNTMHGRPFESTYPWSIDAFWTLMLAGQTKTVPLDASYLGIHFEPGLLVLLPFYALYPSPATLVALQAALGGLTAIPVYLFSRERLRSAPLGAALAISYLLHPALMGMLLTDFHAQALLVFWIAMALWLVSIRRWRLVGLVAALALLTNEVAAIPLAMLGLYVATIGRRRAVGLALFAACVAYFVVVTGIVIPRLSLTGAYLFSGYFNRWGSTPTAIAVGILTQPGAVLVYLTGQDQLTYLLGLLAPTLFLALLGPGFCAIALPVVIGNLLANSNSQRLLIGQYNATILAPLYFAMSVGLSRLIRRLKELPMRPLVRSPLHRAALTSIVVVLVVAAAGFAYSRLSYYDVGQTLRTQLFPYPTNVEVINRMIARLPEQAAVATSDNLSTHLSRHRELHIFPVYGTRVDYVLMPTTETRIWPLTREQATRYVDDLRRSPDHEVLAEEGGYILIHRRAARW